jgi:hypothetical protein
MNSLLKHTLAVFSIVGSMVALLNLQACQNEQPIAKVEEVDTDAYSATESEQYKELSEYLDSVANEYDIDVAVVDEESEELPYDEETLDVVSTTEGDTTFEEVIRIEASTFGEAFASARYQLGPNQEFIWEANGVTYTTNFAEEESKGVSHTPEHYWTDAEINSGTVIDSTQAPY